MEINVQLPGMAQTQWRMGYCKVLENAVHPLLTNCQSSLTVTGNVSSAKLRLESSGIESIFFTLKKGNNNYQNK